MTEIEAKVVLLGRSGVGKSSIVQRFVKDEFSQSIKISGGTAFQFKTVPSPSGAVKFLIWDTAGQDQYKTLAPLYYREAKVGIVVYDITSMESFKTLRQWIQELKESGPEDLRIVILGNKSDLCEKIQVAYEDASDFAKETGALFSLTSAKENKGIGEIFQKLAGELTEQSEINKQQKNKHRDSHYLNKGNSTIKKKKKCEC